MDRPLSRLFLSGSPGSPEKREIGAQISSKLSNFGISNCGQFLASSPLLLRSIGLDISEIAYVHSLIEEGIAPTPVTAKDMLDSKCDTLVLPSYHGSNTNSIFESGVVTELTGPPLVGKTFLSVNMTVRFIIDSIHRRNLHRVEGSAQSPPSLAIYVDAKKKINSKSGLELEVEKIVEECASKRDPTDSNFDISVHEVLQCFRIKNVESSDSLLTWLESEEFQMAVSSSDVATIVIDSLSFLVTQFPPENKDLGGFVIKLTTVLRRLADSCDCPVVITTSIPAGTFVREKSERGEVIRERYINTFPLSPILQHCTQTRHILLFGSPLDPTMPALDMNGQRCLLSEMMVGRAQCVSYFDLSEIGALLRPSLAG